jgi:hypothetical protein
MQIKVYLESHARVTGTLEIRDDFFKVNPDGWISVPTEDWLAFGKGQMRIKKGAYLSLGEFPNLVYRDIKFPECGAIDFETTDDVEIGFDLLKFDFYIADKNDPNPYHGEIEISPGTLLCLPTIDYKKDFTPDNGKQINDDYDYFCFTPA